MAEAVGRGQHGDDAVGAGGVGGAQLGVDVAGVGDEVGAVVDHGDAEAVALEAGPPASSAAARSGTSTTVAAGA